jgi:response regulator RpfG family c-di-GMP phosphodiesterase
MLAASDEYVVLFTDIMMPEIDGITLIREARQMRPGLIPIVMTGYATLETARAAVKEGAYDYVLKPFSLSEIKLAVTNATERYRLSNENTRLREVTELFNISERIASIREEKDLLDFVLRAALQRVNAERGSIMLTTADGKSLEVATSVGVPEEAMRASVKMGSGISGWVAENVRPLLIEDIRQNPDVVEASRRLQSGSFISVPLERKQPRPEEQGSNAPRVLAVLNVTDRVNGTQFTEADLKIISIVANHAAAALENVRLIKDIEEAHLSTLQSMALLLEAKDAYTHGHSERVKEYSVLAARRLGLSKNEIDTLSLGAALHDIGKVGVKDAVLTKDSALTNEEWCEIRRHPVIGFDVLSPVRILSQEHIQLVRGHHERIDGSGYPDKLVGDQISILTRIIAVADSYDAMSSNRAYRRARPAEYITEQLRKYSGTQFDPVVADLFVEMVEKGDLGRGDDAPGDLRATHL